jgi:hypothetical protein
VPIQPASSLDQYAITDSYAPATAGRETVDAPTAQPAPAPVSAEEPSASAEPAPPITPGVYARNARPVAMKMATPSISFLA